MMKLLVIRFLLVGEMLHAGPILRDFKSIASRGHRVVGVFPVLRKTPEDNGEGFSIDAVVLQRFLPMLSYLEFCLRAMTRIIKRHRNAQAMIFETDEYPLAVPWLLRRVLTNGRSPVIVFRDSDPFLGTHGVRTLYRSLLREFSLRLSRFADVVFAISPLHAKDIGGRYGTSPERLHVWPSAVDTELFNPCKYANDRNRVRKELGIGDSFLIMHHGWLEKERGLRELLEAMRIVHDTNTDISLLLLGKGPDKEKLRALADSYGLNGTVIFRDPVPHQDVPRLIAAADAGVHPLPDKPQWVVQTPTKVLEYLSMRKPVVVTDIAANRWIVENRPVAFFCGRGSPKEIAQAILQCARTGAEIPESERDRIAARFSADRVADRVLMIIEKARPS